MCDSPAPILSSNTVKWLKIYPPKGKGEVAPWALARGSPGSNSSSPGPGGGGEGGGGNGGGGEVGGGEGGGGECGGGTGGGGAGGGGEGGGGEGGGGKGATPSPSPSPNADQPLKEWRVESEDLMPATTALQHAIGALSSSGTYTAMVSALERTKFWETESRFGVEFVLGIEAACSCPNVLSLGVFEVPPPLPPDYLPLTTCHLPLTAYY